MGQYDFAVYRTVDVPFEDIISVLAGGQLGDKNQGRLWHAKAYSPPSKLPSALIAHHRSVAAAENVKATVFVLVDKETWRHDGILVINLSFTAHVDALRMLAHDAGDNVPALMTTTTWDQYLRIAERPLFPRRAFAVYFLRASDEEGVAVEEVLNDLNGGFGGRKRLPPREEDREPVCVAVAQQYKSIDHVKARHGQLANEEDFHPRYLIAVRREDWAEHNVLLVDLEGTDGKATELTLEAEVVGELVQWIWAGLVSVEEIVKESNGGEIGPAVLYVKYVDG